MIKKPYFIHLEERPLRIAWILRFTEDNISLAMDIIEYSVDSWAGRYYPIITTDNEGKISDPEWQLLKAYDPDVIESYCDLAPETIKKIERELSPLKLTVHKKRNNGLRQLYGDIHYSPASVPISKESGIFASGFFNENTKLVLFDSRYCKDKLLKAFLQLSFGYITNLRNSNYRQFFKEHVQYEEDITMEGVSSALKRQTHSWDCVYPIELAAIDKPQITNESRWQWNTSISVFIGDTLSDVLWYWNRAICFCDYPRLFQIYLPTALVDNKEIMDSVSKWLIGRTKRNDNHYLEITSISLEVERLKTLAIPLIGNETSKRTKFVQCKVKYDVNGAKFRYYPSHQPSLFPSSYTHVRKTTHQSNSSDSFIKVGGLNWPQVISPKYRMLDLYIEHQSPTLSTWIGSTGYWMMQSWGSLPERMFNKSGRVDGRGIPSLILDEKEFSLTIDLPKDDEFLQTLITRYRDNYPQNDPRDEYSPLGYSQVWLSDKGGYLNGILRLFEYNLDFCGQNIEHPFWSNIFHRLACGRDSKAQLDSQNKLLTRIENTLNKGKEQKWRVQNTALKMLSILQNVSNAPTHLTLGEILSEAKVEIEKYNESNPDIPFPFKEEDVKREISYFTRLGVLLLGLELRCRGCGLRFWRNLEDARQNFRCPGCNRQRTMRGDEQISFHINNLIGSGIIQHGLGAVIKTLCFLLREKESSFMFVESLDLSEGHHSPPIGDLDVVCLLDGKLCIGEVKESWREFNQDVFDKLGDIAIRIRPDVLIIASNGEPPSGVIKKVKALSKTLAQESIGVRIIPLETSARGSTPHF